MAERLQDTTTETGFPPHIFYILDPGKNIKATEIACRLVHVCMVESGFIPMIDGVADFPVEVLSNMTIKESVPGLIRRLQVIIDRTGSLHNVTYKCIVLEEKDVDVHTSEQGSVSDRISTEEIGTKQLREIPLDKKLSEETISNTVTAKESGDASLTGSSQTTSPNAATNGPPASKWEKVYSDNISVSIVHDGFDIVVIANGPGFHKNTLVPFSRYIQSLYHLPESAKAEEYLRYMNFSSSRFADDVKRKFCYEIMDEIDGLSFDIRSLSWLPPEIIVEIGKRVGPLAVFRMRSTCSEIRNALDRHNVQLWKMLLKRDFPHFNFESLKGDSSKDKYFKKYNEMWRVTLRPLRRGVIGRNLPFYFLNNY